MLRSRPTTREDGGDADRVSQGLAGGRRVSRWLDGTRTPVCPVGLALHPPPRDQAAAPQTKAGPYRGALPRGRRSPHVRSVWPRRPDPSVSESRKPRPSPERRRRPRFPPSPLQETHGGDPPPPLSSAPVHLSGALAWRVRAAHAASGRASRAGPDAVAPRRPALGPPSTAPRERPLPARSAQVSPEGQLPREVTHVSVPWPECLAWPHWRGHQKWTRHAFLVEAARGLGLASKVRAEERRGPRWGPTRRDARPSTWQQRRAWLCH